jgi:hypothetical protein
VPSSATPVNISGAFYNVADAVQPDPAQRLQVSVFGQDPDAVADTRTLGLVAGPVLDRNGHPVPDGTVVSFALVSETGASSTATARTVDGLAGAQLAASGRGRYTATASVGALTSAPLQLTVGSGPVEVATAATPAEQQAPSDGGSGVPLLALAIGVPAAVAFAGGGAAGMVLYRRRRGMRGSSAASLAPTPGPDIGAEADALTAAAPAAPPALHVDAETRRVYVRGNEAKPPLSNEQFRLLLYLYERAGKVVGREELVQHVWPDVHAEGVSEEALDALVRRVRERIVQAGGERSYIVTLRGQGFRLEA